MKVLPFKRKQEDQDLSSVEKSLNLSVVAHQKLERLESLLDQGQILNNEDLVSDLKKLNLSLDFILKRSTSEKYKKVV